MQATDQYIIWNAGTGQRIYPHGRDGKSVFESRAEAIRERHEFFERMVGFGVPVPVMAIKPLEDEPAPEPSLAAAVRGEWNNAD